MTTVKTPKFGILNRVSGLLENAFCGILGIGDCDSDSQSRDVVLAVNGGMGHIYVRNRGTQNWADTPREQDINVALTALRGNAVSNLLFNLNEVVDRVLVRRNGWGSGYRHISLAGRELNISSTDRKDKLIQKLDSIRSGDVIIVLKDGFYFDKPEDYPGNHGGLAETDLNIPLVLAGPGVQSGKDSSDTSNTQVAATVYQFLTGGTLPDAEEALTLTDSP